MTFSPKFWRGILYGSCFGLCLGMYLTSQLYVGKLPDNPSYVEQMDRKIQERLGLPPLNVRPK